MDCWEFSSNCLSCVPKCFFVYWDSVNTSCINTTKGLSGSPLAVLDSFCPEDFSSTELPLVESSGPSLLGLEVAVGVISFFCLLQCVYIARRHSHAMGRWIVARISRFRAPTPPTMGEEACAEMNLEEFLEMNPPHHSRNGSSVPGSTNPFSESFVDPDELSEVHIHRESSF